MRESAFDAVRDAFGDNPRCGAHALKTLCLALRTELQSANSLVESIDDALEASSDFLDGEQFRGETLIVHVDDLRRHLDDLRACLAVYA